MFLDIKNLQNQEISDKTRLKQIAIKNQVNKIIKAYRIYRDRQTKYRSINYTTDINAISNLNTNINVYPNKNNKNNLFNNINQDNTNNQKTKDEDLDENLNIDNTITRNNEYLIHNSNNNNQNLNSNFSQEQYVTEQSSSSQSFTKTINYIGERDSDGLKKGFGIEQRGDGTIFKGIYKNDKLEGWGLQIRDTGEYRGQFEEGRTCGYGIFTQKNNGSSYYGEWMDDMLFGIGFEIWKDNSRYEGEYNNGVKNGFGSYIVDGHVMYCGEWYNNNIEGFGIYTYLDGRQYIGEWKSNKMEGYGEYHMNEGKIYFGFYKNDKRDGFGIHYFPEDKFYVGFWKDGKQHGMGKIINKDKINFYMFNQGKKIKTFLNEEEFLDNLGIKEKNCEEFFRWNIDKLKGYLRFEGYTYDEDDNINIINSKKKKKLKGKKHKKSKKNNNEEKMDE